MGANEVAYGDMKMHNHALYARSKTVHPYPKKLHDLNETMRGYYEANKKDIAQQQKDHKKVKEKHVNKKKNKIG